MVPMVRLMMSGGLLDWLQKKLLNMVGISVHIRFSVRINEKRRSRGQRIMRQVALKPVSVRGCANLGIRGLTV